MPNFSVIGEFTILYLFALYLLYLLSQLTTIYSYVLLLHTMLTGQ